MKKFFDYILIDSLEEIDYRGSNDKPTVINCLNPHSFVTALDDEQFYKALTTSDYLLPDGEGIRYAMKRWQGVRIQKIAGDDLHRRLLKELDSHCGRAYYLGSTEEVLSKIKLRLEHDHPKIQVKTHSPSFCDELSEEESAAIAADIKDFAPEVLFVSMTAPKQEKWVYKHLDKLQQVKIIANVGAAFSFYARTERRAGKIVIALRLEWLWRLAKRPRKIWRRVFISTPKFLRWVRKNSLNVN